MAEVLVSLTILSMVGAGVASMLTAVSQGTTAQTATQRVTVKRRVLTSRVDAALRSSCRVLAIGRDVVVLWTGDSRANGLPDLSELRRIEWRAGSGEMWMYAARPDLDEKRDRTFTFDQNFETLTRIWRRSKYFPGQRWGRDIVAWEPSVDSNALGDVRLVRYDITVRNDDGSEAIATRAVALRGRVP
ncbi:MAG: hypothetical protein KJO43_06945 [Phycisphaerae bacterium]|nr:hypothetical protein [Phycisphaerae bacterium]